MAWWLERLSDFDFEVEHRPGQLHGNADGLSRLPWDEGAYIHTYIHTLLARPHGAFQSQFYITKL